MPNLRGKTWTTTTPANVEDAQYWEDHLISDEDAAKIGQVILPAGGTVGQVLTKQSSNPNDADWDDPASSGHTIQDEDGTDMPYQQTLQFVNAEVSNDSVNDRTVVDCKGAKGDAATITVGTVSTLPAGSSATVVNSGTTKDAVFDFGIPEGADGTDGEDGFSPAVTITTIPGGHQVNITDAEHPQGQTFNVMDGSGSGDMQASAYDPNSDVYNAGGIPDYVDDEIATAISGKADKVINATNGNFAGLDSNGNLTDSGKKASDFLPSNTPIPDEVTANPVGTATGTLTKLGIGSDIYDIQGGSGSDKADISAIGTNETGTTASRAYAVGEHFYKNGKFCTCIQAIAQGGQFTLNTNYVEGTVADSITDKLIYETGHTNQPISTKLTSLKTAFWGLSEAQRRKAYIAIDDGLNPTRQLWLNINSGGIFLCCGNSSNSLLRMDIIRIVENETPTWRAYTLQTTGITIDEYTYVTIFSFQLWVSGK